MTNDLGPADVLTPVQQVRLELRSRPGCYLTAATLAELTGLRLDQVHHALYRLTRQHKIIRFLRTRARDGQSYCWNYRGMS